MPDEENNRTQGDFIQFVGDKDTTASQPTYLVSARREIIYIMER